MALGPLPTLTGLSAVLVAVLIGVTLPRTVPGAPGSVSAYAVLPSGVIAMASTPEPGTPVMPLPATLTGLSAVLVAVLIGVTVGDLPPVTYAVFPFGVIAMAYGVPLTLIGLSAVLVAVRIGVTV